MKGVERRERKYVEVVADFSEDGRVTPLVIVWDDGSIVGEGYNRRETDGDALGHAEIMAIRQACQTLGGWRLHKARLYVTLEPCPMCAGAILNARVSELHYAAKDETMGACGSVLNLFEESFGHRPRLYRGPLEAECAQLLTNFFAARRRGTQSSPCP